MFKRKVFLLIFLLIGCSTVFAHDKYVSFKLQRGVQVQIPSDWKFFSDDQEKFIKAGEQAIIESSGLNIPASDKVTLLRSHAMPRTKYAYLSVASTMPPSMSPSFVKSLTRSELKHFEGLRLKYVKSLSGHSEILEYYGVQRDSFNGNPALVTNYLRSGPMGPVHVQLIDIYTENQTVSVTLSHRKSESDIWNSILKQIRQSVKVSN